MKLEWSKNTEHFYLFKLMLKIASKLLFQSSCPALFFMLTPLMLCIRLELLDYIGELLRPKKHVHAMLDWAVPNVLTPLYSTEFSLV